MSGSSVSISTQIGVFLLPCSLLRIEQRFQSHEAVPSSPQLHNEFTGTICPQWVPAKSPTPLLQKPLGGGYTFIMKQRQLGAIEPT